MVILEIIRIFFWIYVKKIAVFITLIYLLMNILYNTAVK